MSRRWPVLAVAAAAIVLVFAQVLYPASALYHSWQYALALAVALVVFAAFARGARSRTATIVDRRLSVALAGAAVIDLAGLAAGLLGPDTSKIVGTPGTVVPVPALGVAAFFASVDASALERGSASVTLRRRGVPPTEIAGNGRRVLGESLLYLEPRPAAYIDTADGAGAHLTVTQPTNSSFLSPILLFRGRQRIAALDLPFDTFATPAKHRVFRALYITPAQLAVIGHAQGGPDGHAPAVILTASDDRGTSLGITLALSGETVDVGGVRVHVTLGTYPALAIAAAPLGWVLVAGILIFLAGGLWTAAAVPGMLALKVKGSEPFSRDADRLTGV